MIDIFLKLGFVCCKLDLGIFVLMLLFESNNIVWFFVLVLVFNWLIKVLWVVILYLFCLLC